MSSALYIAAKAPVPGQVKTRLAAAIGDTAATELYVAFLRDLGRRFPHATWFVAQAGASPHVTDCYMGQPSARILAQPDGDWTERQRALFRGAAKRGEERVVLIASDSPQLSTEIVDEAFDLLDEHELVLGPTLDGGYYLIGMHGWHDVLADVTMSTYTVCGEIARNARARGLGVATVEPTYDVDEVEDLELLERDAAVRDDLSETRSVLSAIRAEAVA